MWVRNLVFIGLLLGGATALGAALFPPAVPSNVRGFIGYAFQDENLLPTLRQVNLSLRQKWSDLSSEPAPPASELTVARRLSLALTGTIPSLQEIRQFEAQPEGLRLVWWLNRILDDRRFADYAAERLARVYVGNEDGPFLVFRRRRFVSWLSDEVMKNAPYDAIVRELISSQGLWTDKPATNFLTVTFDPVAKAPNPERLAARFARAFLGARIDCAQCHNHPFEKWKQADFRGLAAFFAQAQQGLTGIHDAGGEFEVDDRKTGARLTVQPSVPFKPELLPQQGTRRQQLAAWVTNPQNPYLARATANRVWALMFGKPLVEPVDSVTAAGDVPPALQALADDFTAHSYDLRRLIRIIAATEAFRLDSAADHEITDAHENAWAAFPVSRLRPEQVVGSVLQAASLETINTHSHIFTKIGRFFGERDFVQRYGDTGEDEFDGRGGTIPQRLLMMNGQLVKDKTKEFLFNAATRIGWLAPDDRTAVETAYLGVLTRRPTPEEAAHFEARLAATKGTERSARMEDLYWTLINSSECSWNH